MRILAVPSTALIALFLVASLGRSSPVAGAKGPATRDGSSAQINVSQPKKAGDVTLNIKYNFITSSGSEQNADLIVNAPISLPTTPNAKAEAISDAINAKANDPDGDPATNDAAPLDANHGGDGINIFTTSKSREPQGTTIEDVNIDNDTRARDIIDLGSVEDTSTMGEVGLAGVISGTPFRGSQATLTLVLGADSYSTSLTYGDTFLDALSVLEAQAEADGWRMAVRPDGSATIERGVDGKGTRIGIESNDLTLRTRVGSYRL